MSAFLPLKTSDKQGTTCNLPYVRHVAYGQAGGMNTTTYGQQKGRIVESAFGHETVILVVQTRLEHAWVLVANVNPHSNIERAGLDGGGEGVCNGGRSYPTGAGEVAERNQDTECKAVSLTTSTS